MSPDGNFFKINNHIFRVSSPKKNAKPNTKKIVKLVLEKSRKDQGWSGDVSTWEFRWLSPDMAKGPSGDTPEFPSGISDGSFLSKIPVLQS